MTFTHCFKQKVDFYITDLKSVSTCETRSQYNMSVTRYNISLLLRCFFMRHSVSFVWLTGLFQSEWIEENNRLKIKLTSHISQLSCVVAEKVESRHKTTNLSFHSMWKRWDCSHLHVTDSRFNIKVWKIHLILVNY